MDWKTLVMSMLAEVSTLASHGIKVDKVLDTVDAIIDVRCPDDEDPEPYYEMVYALRRLYVYGK